MAFEIQYFGHYPYKDLIHVFLENWNQDGAFTFSTSGTSGRPKIIAFTKSQLIASAQASINVLGLGSNEHLLLSLHPSMVGGAMVIARALVLNCRLSVVVPDHSLWNLLPQNEKFTLASFVPAQLMNPHFDRVKFNAIQKVLLGGGPLPPQFEPYLNIKDKAVFHTYGMTETLSHIALRQLGKDKAFKPLDGVILHKDTSGCLVIKVPFLPDAVQTMDLIEWESENTFTIIGRADQIINSGGIKINPELVEMHIMNWIAEKEVIQPGHFVLSSRPHQKWGEELVMVSEYGISDLDFEELKNYLAQKIATYHIPKIREILFPFLLTESMKPKRSEIKKWLSIK